MVDDRPSRQFQNLQRADDPDTVVGIDPRGRHFVPRPEYFVKMGFSQPAHLLPQRLPQGFVRPRSVDQPPKGPDIKTGTADYEDRSLFPLQIGNDPVRQPDIQRNVERFIRIDHVEKVVGNPLPLFRRRLRGTDIHVPVNLHGIGADDLAAPPVGQFQGHRCFSYTGRSKDTDQPRFGDVSAGHTWAISS